MRKALFPFVAVALAAAVWAGPAGGDRARARIVSVSARSGSLPGQLSAGMPAGWHVLRGWLSDVIDPAPRLAAASFPVRLSHRTCECGLPNVVRFPRDGALVFVWEYLHPSRRMLAEIPSRPARFRIAAGRGVRLTCDGPTDTLTYKDAGRVLQVEVYLGPGARSLLREQTAELLHSLRAA